MDQVPNFADLVLRVRGGVRFVPETERPQVTKDIELLAIRALKKVTGHDVVTQYRFNARFREAPSSYDQAKPIMIFLKIPIYPDAPEARLIANSLFGYIQRDFPSYVEDIGVRVDYVDGAHVESSNFRPEN